MAILTGSTIGLTQGASIIAVVLAKNEIGWGPQSLPNTGTAVVQVKPYKPPTVPIRDSSSTDTALVVDWNALINPDNGGGSITSYNL